MRHTTIQDTQLGLTIGGLSPWMGTFLMADFRKSAEYSFLFVTAATVLATPSQPL